jgi:opacity protein-like surface antigen
MSRTNVLLVLAFCLILGTTAGLAQGFYVNVNAGYGFGAGTQQFGYNYTSTGPTSSYEGMFGSYGEGFKLGASAGYMFNENIGAELGLSYWLGKSIEATYKTTTMTQSQKWSSWGIVAVPSVVISANMKPVNPYARFGLVLGLLNPKTELNRIEPGNNMDAVTEDVGGVALGFAGALGIVVPTGSTVGFFAEVVLHSVSYSPSKYKITKYNINGVDQLPSLSHKEIDYKESFSSSDQYVTLAARRPFSSIGLAVGVRINL